MSIFFATKRKDGLKMFPFPAGVIVAMTACNNARAALHSMESGQSDSDYDFPSFLKVTLAIILSFAYLAFTWYLVSSIYDIFFGYPRYSAGAIEYFLLSLGLIWISPLIVLPIWGIVRARKWLASNSKVSCKEWQNSSVKETKSTVTARVHEIWIIKKDKIKQVNEISVSDHKRKYIVIFSYGGIKYSVYSFNRLIELKKGDEIDVTLVEWHYPNGKIDRKIEV
jgi:hypothetical protein